MNRATVILSQLFGSFLVLASCLVASANENTINYDPLTAKGYILPNSLPAGSNGELKIEINLEKPHHAYFDMFTLKVLQPKEAFLGKFLISPTVEFFDKYSKKNREGIKDRATLKAAFEVPEKIKPGQYQAIFALRYQACTDTYCLLPKTIEVKVPFTALATTAKFGSMSIEAGTPKTPGSDDSSQRLMKELFSGNLVMAFTIIFFAGILTSLTPCVFPMIPITLAILGGRPEGHSSREGFLLSLSYVHGIAITYAILGLIAATTGALFGSLLGHPLVVSAIAVVFVLLGLSMYGLFEIKLPDALTNRLLKNKTNPGYIGAFLTGLVAGIVASPCVGPVLVAVLAYVAHTQNQVLGFFLLFTFAMGLGQLFIILGTFSQLTHRLPKSGPWLNLSKMVFGTTMIAMALYYVYPVISDRLLPNFSIENKQGPEWTAFSDKALKQAIAEGRPVIIDFYADWCGACKELERLTFSKPQVLEVAKDFLWLKFDATEADDSFNELAKRYEIFGLPHLVFYDKEGKYRKDLTLTGFEGPKKFRARIDKLNTPSD